MNEKREESLTVRELIAKSGTVFDTYFLARIVEAAPSPTAADRYVSQELGWSCGVGQAVRTAVRLRDKYKDKPEEWQRLKQTTLQPIEMFGFKEAPFFPPESQITMVENLGLVCLRVPYRNWPWLLRELAGKNKEGEIISTFDFAGRAFPKKIESLADARHHDFYAFFGSSENEERDLGKDYGRLTFFSEGGSRIVKDRLSIYARSCELAPGSGKVFPRFYKIVEISQFLPGSAVERVLIFIRQEIAKGLKESHFYLPKDNLGEVIYERDISVSLEIDRVVARLSVSYKINFDLTCEQVPAQFHSAPISIQYCYPGCCPGNNTWINSPGQPHPDFRLEKISEAMKELSELAGCFFGREGQEPFPLERVAGDNLWVSPPEHLASRFVL